MGDKEGTAKTMTQYGNYSQYRARITWDTNSSDGDTWVLKYSSQAQMRNLAYWGIKITASISGDYSGYSGYRTGSDTGYLTNSSDSYSNAASTGTITFKLPKGHSTKDITLKGVASGVTVSGYRGVDAGDATVSQSFTVPAKTKYTISYKANGGSNSGSTSDTKWYGETLTLFKGTNFSRTGYTLSSWNTSASGNGTTYKLGGSYTKNASDVLYAIWTAKTYTLTYNANGGTVSPTSKTITYNSTYGTLATPTRTGYSFSGWYTATSGGTHVTSSTSVSTTGNRTIYAHWTANTYTLTYNANGGSVSPTSKSITFDSTYGTLPTPTRTGYTFNGWYTATSGGTEVTSSTSVSTTGNRTIYAHWTPVTYQVTYNANSDGSPVTNMPANQVKVHDTSLVLSSVKPVRENHNFINWNTNSSGTGDPYSPGQTYSNNQALSLYARWEEAHQIPKITKLNIIRVNEQEVENDEGVYGRISFNYAFDSSVSAGIAFIEYKASSSSSYSQADSIALNNNTGSISNVLTKTENDETTKVIFSQDEAYNIRISIKDSDQYSSQNSSTFLSKAYFIMDIYGQTEYNEANVSGGFPSGVILYENDSIKSITYSENITSVSVNADTFCENYSFDRIKLEFKYSTATPGWSGTTGDGNYSSNIDLASIGITYVAESLQDDDYIKIEAEKKYIQTADLTPQQNKKYYTATEPGHGIGFGAPAEYDAFKVGLPYAYFSGSLIASSMTGVIQMFGGATAPAGWLICDGSAISREDYAALFAVIGITYGAGDGSTTFNLPDLRGRVPLGVGNGTATGHTNHTLGQQAGQESVTLSSAQSGLPAHGHGFTAPTVTIPQLTSTNSYYLGSSSIFSSTTTAPGGSASENYRYLRVSQTDYDLHREAITIASRSATVSGGSVNNNTGANASSAHTNMQPYLGINFIICTGQIPQI